AMAVRVDESDDLRTADVIHPVGHTLPATATVGDVRAWFDASDHRRLAVLADEGRFAGMMTRSDVDAAPDDGAPAARHARQGPTVDAAAPARDGYDMAPSTDIRRVAVIDADGMLVGVLSVTPDLERYCGARAPDGAQAPDAA